MKAAVQFDSQAALAGGFERGGQEVLLLEAAKDEIAEAQAQHPAHHQPHVVGHDGQHEEVTPHKLHHVQHRLDDVPFVQDVVPKQHTPMEL